MLLKKISILLLLGIFFISFSNAKELKNGFDISNAIINKNLILAGGPPKDGIPAINNPKFLKIKDVSYLRDDDIIIGLINGDIQKAYPTRILVWHEIVNDKIKDKNLVITYCPLCGTAMVFERDIAGITRDFGVSGLLYQSDVLMYDKQTNSLWSQLALESISGASVGSKLKWVNSEYMTYKAWRNKYPDSLILSNETGFYRDYNKNAYEDYFNSDSNMFPVKKSRNELKEKEWVVGIIINGVAKAYSIKDLKEKIKIKDKLAGVNIQINYDKNKKHHFVINENNEKIASVLVYWFAWQAFYPKTLLWH